ncbi:hypothetical protein BDDG_04578 [Blastomyces dermatitidis ATCC 18188]|uniref:Uncharacterized protein n=1 Tax=Ajellomyces dermatitidis (strain ATCC 18188 / CBS 674.68) TaxID=653446 RepID=F2TEH2_AJEDA|nr:hypothetical protein BDDG_04578 [Blastomyces dermatitidis ATCC 18188]
MIISWRLSPTHHIIAISLETMFVHATNNEAKRPGHWNRKETPVTRWFVKGLN